MYATQPPLPPEECQFARVRVNQTLTGRGNISDPGREPYTPQYGYVRKLYFRNVVEWPSFEGTIAYEDEHRRMFFLLRNFLVAEMTR
jgi:hypothetical protein